MSNDISSDFNDFQNFLNKLGLGFKVDIYDDIMVKVFVDEETGECSELHFDNFQKFITINN